jgi:predicted ABC-type ATPase
VCIYVLAGTNGAGKSSIGGETFRERQGDYFNPDEATERILTADPTLSPAQANSQAWLVGKQLLEQSIEERRAYAFETTLGGRTITNLLHRAIRSGIAVRIWYAGLDSPELHIERVRARVARGGHDIPEDKIRERYERSIENLITLLEGLDALRVFDNSTPGNPYDGVPPSPRLVLQMERGKILNTQDLRDTPEWAKPIVAAAMKIHVRSA